MTAKQVFTLVIITLFILMSVAISYLYNQNKSKQIELNRVSQNVETLNSEIKTYKINDSLNVSEITALKYTKSELEKYNAKILSELKIKANKVKTITEIKTVTETKFIEKLDSLKCFEYTTKFDSVSGCINNDSIAIKIKRFERLSCVVWTDYSHKWWFIKYGKKIDKISIYSDNVDTEIKDIKYIEKATN